MEGISTLFIMSEEENPLNPILALTNSISDTGIYTYYLTTRVPDQCIDKNSEEVITDPDILTEIASTMGYTIDPTEVNMVVTYAAISCADPSGVQENTTNITANPQGKKGSIIVLIAPESTSIMAEHGPETSGKAIIRFDKRS